MRLGCCGGLNQAAEIKAAGFDFLEVNVQQVLQGDLPDAQWEAAAPDPARFPLPVEAANCLVPGSRPIVGPQRDLAGLGEYMERVAKRARRLGISRLVLGSGAARKRPDNVVPEMALEQLFEFTRMAGAACARHDVGLLIEHLHAGETNTLNKLAQTMALCDHVEQASVGVLVDCFHASLEHETDEAILRLGDRVRHVHVAEPVKRVQPGAYGFRGQAAEGSRLQASGFRTAETGSAAPASVPQCLSASVPSSSYDFEHFFCLLRKIGYDERISIESSWTRPIAEVGAASAAYLRKCWESAGRCEC